MGDGQTAFTNYVCEFQQGEKMHEQLSVNGKFYKTKHPSIKKINDSFIPTKNINRDLNELVKVLIKNDNKEIVKIIQKIVPEYKGIISD